MPRSELLQSIPSVDSLLSSDDFQSLLMDYGHTRTKAAIRRTLNDIRARAKSDKSMRIPDEHEISGRVRRLVEAEDKSALRPVLNLTGTVLHTNLGRAYLPDAALDAVAAVSRGASNLEFNLESGQRGDRDSHVEELLAELTGAESATLVNNNAAAVLICLNTFANGQSVCISRGELVEIGGSFRIPEIMEKSGCHLVEVGATNRTHPNDYRQAIDERTALLMKVHTSNYEIRGFTGSVDYSDLASIAKESGLPLLADLGSGTLVNLEDHGLEHEPTVREVLAAGVSLVTFSGDKLLGGPQAGIIAGKKALIDAVKKNPLKRALRVDKMTIAALVEVLKLYRHPESLAEKLPSLRYLVRTRGELEALANTLLPPMQAALGAVAKVSLAPAHSQIGSGALPLHQLPTLVIEIKPKVSGDAALQQLSLAFRRLPLPVVGRLQGGKLLLDIRTLQSAGELLDQLSSLDLP